MYLGRWQIKASKNLNVPWNLPYKDESMYVCVCMSGPTQAILTPKFGMGSAFHPGLEPS
jgi:hypothetical protein